MAEPGTRLEITLDSVRAAVNRAASLELLPGQEDDDLSALGMDSLGYVAAVVELEKTFDLLIPDEGMLFSVMNTIRKITEMVRSAAE